MHKLFRFGYLLSFHYLKVRMSAPTYRGKACDQQNPVFIIFMHFSGLRHQHSQQTKSTDGDYSGPIVKTRIPGPNTAVIMNHVLSSRKCLEL